jgi:prepilin-type N-terminal cleavage/methylation domain-containing protein
MCLASIRRVLHRPHPRSADHARPGSGRASLRPRGITLLEVMVVVGIVAVLTAMSLGGYERLTSRANFSSVLGNLMTSLRRTRSEAAGRGVATAFVVDTRGNRWWGVEAPAGWTLGGFDPSSPGTVIVKDTFPTGSGKAVFGPEAGFGAALPAPFATVPVLAAQSPALPYCSFCNPDTGLGAIVFQPTGAASFSGGTLAPGSQSQQLTIQGPNDGRTVLLAVTARTGVVEVFEQ